MPTYTLKDLKTNQEWDIVCSFEDLQKTLDELPNVKQVLKAPQIIGGRMGNKDMKVPEGFKDLKRKIKAGSGRNNKIDI